MRSTIDAVALAARGSAPGWPVVLYFHHVHPELDHYTSLRPEAFRHGLSTVLERVGPAIDPASVGPAFTPPDAPGILVTFDDGYRDNLRYALPILHELGVRALFFCVTGWLDVAGCGRVLRAPGLTWQEAGALVAAGHVLGAHTCTHRPLTELAEHEAAAEVHGSLAAITRRTGAPTRAFAYPYGLVPDHDVLPEDVLGFGTVKSPPMPWASARTRVRRTFLPTDSEHAWVGLAEDWRRQWYGGSR